MTDTTALDKTRDEAWALLTEFTEKPGLIKHALAVEAAMRACARREGADEHAWGLVGLLHDFDYDRWPSAEDHPFRGSEILAERGWPEWFRRAILSHADYAGVPRESRLERSLFACDELCGFLTACALVNPAKRIADVRVKSVKKRLKSKAFAASVNRDDIRAGAAELGVELDEHIAFVIEALAGVAGELELDGRLAAPGRVTARLEADGMAALFPGARDIAYLNTAAQCLLPAPVVEAMHRVALSRGQRGVLVYRDDMADVEAARRRAADLVHAERPEQVAFTAGTTDGIARVAQGLDWREGDRVVLADCEYPANVFPWAALAPRGVRLDVVRAVDGCAPAAALVDAIGPRTRVVAASHVQFGSGYRLDAAAVGAACRERGALFVLDAIQSAGVVDVDVQSMRVDALAVDGRKWLMGPPGCGFLYVGERCLERLHVVGAGAGSVTTVHEPQAWKAWIDADGQVDPRPHLRPDALRLQGGFPDVIGIAGLDAGLALAERIGRRRIRDHVAHLVARTVASADAAGLRVFGPQRPQDRAGIVSIATPGDTGALVAELLRQGIAVANRDGRIRVSPHVHSTEEHIDRLFEVLAASASR